MTATIEGTDNGLAAALELDHVQSHLHPEPSYDVEAHPKPTGLEEIWRFTPLKRLRGLLDGTPSDACLEWKDELPAGASLSTITTDEAKALGGIAPLDRLAALAVQNAGGATLLSIDGELDAPARIRLTGPSVDETVWGHIVVKVAPFSKATIAFDHVGSATYATNVTYVVGDGAQLDVVNLADWEDDAVHAVQNGISVGRDATVRFFEFTLGGDLVRSSTNVDYRGSGGSVDLLGIYFADAGQHLEHRQFVDHTAPKTRSNVEYKGALQGQDAHTVWIGNVLIRKVAEGIETFEQNDNLVLTDGARADSVPNLEIETGDIAGAGHASTTGRFDDEHLFYLQSRGIDPTEAKRLVVHGFFNDIIRRIGVADLQERLMSAIEDELAAVVGNPSAVSA
ncbi:Fe-S cluster assembly protein SufD [Aeromicrobium tamlense]|uniref:Fe-S cluster assembly protein SufD n=1 Tax=Aeromicrobium tamlense TaxID=375541 RepID=A0A8I0FXL7_9ACTN|nr:Fe-S cluster assembly protein SufD [Aeromicrobium tamlense]MBD1270841.1 Fe-S cluster assembly protein SufD [Aeromicrobium tamlense]NYI38231.1 Fe-S cluster assembly protein SufD [Aeromicrobium tamlense]